MSMLGTPVTAAVESAVEVVVDLSTLSSADGILIWAAINPGAAGGGGTVGALASPWVSPANGSVARDYAAGRAFYLPPGETVPANVTLTTGAAACWQVWAFPLVGVDAAVLDVAVPSPITDGFGSPDWAAITTVTDGAEFVALGSQRRLDANVQGVAPLTTVASAARWGGSAGASVSGFVGSVVVATAGATGPHSTTADASDPNVSVALVLRPASDPTAIPTPSGLDVTVTSDTQLDATANAWTTAPTEDPRYAWFLDGTQHGITQTPARSFTGLTPDTQYTIGLEYGEYRAE